MASETRVTRVSEPTAVAAAAHPSLVQIYGPELGKKFELESAEVTIGRAPECEIVVDLDNVSRRHAQLANGDDGWVVRDLGSTNGTFVNNAEIAGDYKLANGDLIKVGGSIFKFLVGGNVEALYHEEIYRMTIIDGLTQVYNKRYFLEFLEREMARCQRYERALSLMMMDIDFFKKVNDTHGHIAGDHVLREVAAAIKSKTRKEECFARYGGEEFGLVIPEAGHDKAIYLAEKLRHIVEEKEIAFEGKRIPVTLSIGVSDMTADLDGPLAFIKVADERLYRAKKEGRNRVVG
jgi:diguanylate cyclase (GGDEF)-like protein